MNYSKLSLAPLIVVLGCGTSAPSGGFSATLTGGTSGQSAGTAGSGGVGGNSSAGGTVSGLAGSGSAALAGAPGAAGSGGVPGTGGTGTSMAGSSSSMGGRAMGGMGGMGGVPAMAGTVSAMAGMDSGSMGGGSAGMGAAGMASGGSGSTSSDPAPSPGCSGGNASAMIANSIIDKPSDYDGSTPLPLVIALHANGNPNTQLQGYFGAEGKSRGYLLVYPKSAGGNWSFQSDRGRIDDAYDGMLNNYCVDMNRVYGVGHSGGAQTLTQLLCAGDDRFRAVAPIASSKYCNGWDSVAAFVIHGTCDQERGGGSPPECPTTFSDKYGVNDVDGRVDFSVHHGSNSCSDQSSPFTPGGTCAASIDPGCEEYQGCSARTVFCNHNDPEYSGTNHGIPCFAKVAVFDFFDAEN